MKVVYDNSTIESNSSEIISRDIRISGYIQLQNVGNCFSYKCKRNSEAKIIKELNPKVAIYNNNSLLDKGTVLECENMIVYISNLKKPYKPVVINYSSTHKAQTFTTKKYTIAKISKQIPNIPQSIPPIEIDIVKKKLPPTKCKTNG